ncbi:unnamed protein product, partial [Rotaria sordida]
LNIEDKNSWTPLYHVVRINALSSMEFVLSDGIDHI